METGKSFNDEKGTDAEAFTIQSSSLAKSQQSSWRRMLNELSAL